MFNDESHVTTMIGLSDEEAGPPSDIQGEYHLQLNTGIPVTPRLEPTNPAVVGLLLGRGDSFAV